MNILFSTDNNYVMPTGVLMHSISINNPQDVYYYLMVNESFSKENEDKLRLIAKQYGNHISFHTITDEVTKVLPFGKDNMPGHVSIATYYRLFVAQILPEDVHKIIYLDGDMVVRGSLDKLWNTDLDGYAIAAVHDMDEQKHIDSHRLPYPMETGYFNAGMQLINVDYWRKNDCLSLFMNFLKEHADKIVYHDQDVLNCCLYDKKKWVPVTYNFQNGFVLKQKFYPKAIYNEVEETLSHPVVIHYSTDLKPWNISCFHPYRNVWRRYKSLSQWKNLSLEGDYSSNLKELVRNFLLRHSLWNPNSSPYRKLPNINWHE